METASGEPPSAPPRYNAPRSVLHALKGPGPAPVASVVPADNMLASSMTAAPAVAVETVEVETISTSATTSAPCIPTETASSVMTTKVSLAVNDNGSLASPVHMASNSGAGAVGIIPMGDSASVVTESMVNSVAPEPATATVNGTSVVSSQDVETMSSPVALPTETMVKSLPVQPASPTVVVVAPSPGTPPEPTSPTTPEGSAPHDLSTPQPFQDMGSQYSLGMQAPKAPPAPDTLSYLDSVSLMSGTLESLTGPGFLDDASSMGSDSEINGMSYRKTDKYGFLGGTQYSDVR